MIFIYRKRDGGKWKCISESSDYADVNGSSEVASVAYCCEKMCGSESGSSSESLHQ